MSNSNVLTFEIARAPASAKAMPKAGPKLLEPMMRVEVVTPDEYMGDVIGDLNSRRGQISGMDSRGNARVISAMVPLAKMFGYVNTLRSHEPGTGPVHHAFRPLRAGAPGRGRRSARQDGVIVCEVAGH